MVCKRNCFNKGSPTGFLTYEEFQRKYRFKTNFLNFYQVLSIIPYYLLFKARNLDDILKNVYFKGVPKVRFSYFMGYNV